jgi:tRNA (cmo5U34)-methyltransferase
MKKDTIYQTALERVEPFRFSAEVAGVFDDMIARSVPGYEAAQQMTVKLLNALLPPGGVVYDLGCSTGTTLLTLAERLADPTIQFVGVDNSPPMLERCRAKVDQYTCRGRIELRCEDLRQVRLPGADGAVFHYTLQFVPPEERFGVLQTVAQDLNPGGVVVLTEKIRFNGPRLHEVMTSLHLDHKRGNNYSELEIAQKRAAIEDVLIPLTAEENLELLRASGFAECAQVCQWLNFAMFVALKPR